MNHNAFESAIFLLPLLNYYSEVSEQTSQSKRLNQMRKSKQSPDNYYFISQMLTPKQMFHRFPIAFAKVKQGKIYKKS